METQSACVFANGKNPGRWKHSLTTKPRFETAYQIYSEWPPKPCLIYFLNCSRAELCGLTCHPAYILTWRSDKASGEGCYAEIIHFIEILRHGFEGRYLHVGYVSTYPDFFRMRFSLQKRMRTTCGFVFPLSQIWPVSKPRIRRLIIPCPYPITPHSTENMVEIIIEIRKYPMVFRVVMEKEDAGLRLHTCFMKSWCCRRPPGGVQVHQISL